MDIDSILAHHLLDHRIAYLFSIGPLPIYLTSHGVIMVIAALLLLITFSLAVRRGRRPGGVAVAAPTGIVNALEAVAVYMRDEIVRPNLGPAGDRYLPYFLTLFFFILTCNLIGMVPFGKTATANIAVTSAMAFSTFCMINFTGVRHQGALHYVGSLVPHGLPVWLVPVMFVLEVLGLFTRALALAVRLFANMIAGHIALLVILCLIFIFKSIWVAPVSVAAAVAISLLEVFVCFLQAYVFTLLTALFVGAAVHPQH